MAKRPKQEEIPMKGPGVAPVKDKKLDALADKFVEMRDEKSKLAEEMTNIEANIVARMQEIKCESYRYADREVKITKGKVHVKVKTVKNEGAGYDTDITDD